MKPKKHDGKLFFGELYHKFQEVYYQSGDEEAAHIAMKALYEDTDTSKMDQVELDGLMELATAVTSGYVNMWKKKDKHTATLATELTFAIPISDKIAYAGTIDRIYLDADQRLWLKDYKTAASIERYRSASEMDRQISRYLWAMQRLCRGEGYILLPSPDTSHESGNEWIPISETAFGAAIARMEVYGFEYDIVAKDVPTRPELLKKGGLSVAKAQKTTYALYLEALLAHGWAQYATNPDGDLFLVTDDKYEEMLQHLKNQEDESGNKFFRRFEVRRHQEEMDASMIEFLAQAGEAEALRTSEGHSALIYRNVTHDCSWDCPFKQVCIGTMDGSRMDEVIGLFYEKEEPAWPELKR